MRNDSKFRQTISQFQERRVAERTPVLNLNGAQPLSRLRDEVQETTNGLVTDEDSTFRVRHNSAGDLARIASAGRGVYVPGTPAEVGIGIRTDFAANQLSGDAVAEWGYFDMQTSSGDPQKILDGFLFGVDNTGLYIRVVKNGTTVHKTYSKKWNISRVRGLNLKDGSIYQVDFSYYGFGLIVFQRIVAQDGWGNQLVENVHSVRLRGETSITNPNLQVGGIVSGTNNGDDFSIYVAGRQFSVVGKFIPRRRVTAAEADVSGGAISISTSSYTPFLSFQRKENFRRLATQIFGLTAQTDVNAYVQVRVHKPSDNALTGADFQPVPETIAAETAVNRDVSATAVDTTVGYKAFMDALEGGKGSKEGDPTNLEGLFADIPDEGIITFCAKAISTNGSLIYGVGKVEERW